MSVAVAQDDSAFRASLLARSKCSWGFEPHFTPDQAADLMKKIRDLQLANANADPATRKANAAQVKQDVVDELNPDQRAAYESYVNECKAARRTLFPQSGAGPRPLPTSTSFRSGCSGKKGCPSDVERMTGFA